MKLLQEDALVKIIREAGAIMLAADGLRDKIASEKEGRANFVTRYDVEVQRYLERKISELFPAAGFLAEEEGEDRREIRRGFTFVIDPIDGTANFIRDLHCSAISVGLLFEGLPIWGAVYNPYRQELFTASKGHGAYLNGRPIHVTDCSLEDSLVAFGTSPYYREELGSASSGCANAFLDKAQDLRRMGSAALDLANLAAGRLDVFFELRLSPWDFAAGSLLVTEAGGILSDTAGNPLPYGKKSGVVCGNPNNYDEAMKIIRRYV